MKQLTLILTVLAVAITGCQSEEQSPEEQNTDQFASLGQDESFKQAHHEPGEYKVENGQGEMIQYPVAGGKAANAYYIKAEKESHTYIFVFHEWYGLNEYVKKESEKLAEKYPNANILALDLYDGKVATNRDQASEYMQEVDNDRAFAIIDGASEFAGEDARIGTIGWCFGGGWSLQAALKLGKKAHACVIYYGMPIMDMDKLRGLNAPVLGHFGKKDDWITPEKVDQCAQAMSQAGKPLTVHSYDAAHAFANPSRDVYKEGAAEVAWARTINFIDDHLINK
jgi:carboxymethylenebutenolidase